MASDFVEPKDSPEDQEPDVVGTPEGDNEFAPDEPLKKLPKGTEQPLPA